jgi:hypothetical protein
MVRADINPEHHELWRLASGNLEREYSVYMAGTGMQMSLSSDIPYCKADNLRIDQINRSFDNPSKSLGYEIENSLSLVTSADLPEVFPY